MRSSENKSTTDYKTMLIISHNRIKKILGILFKTLLQYNRKTKLLNLQFWGFNNKKNTLKISKITKEKVENKNRKERKGQRTFRKFRFVLGTNPIKKTPNFTGNLSLILISESFNHFSYLKFGLCKSTVYLRSLIMFLTLFFFCLPLKDLNWKQIRIIKIK